MKGISKLEQVYDIFEGIKLPDKDIEIYNINLTHQQQILLSRLISKASGEEYDLLPIQRSYNISHEKTKEGKAFKKLFTKYAIHNREVIFKEDKIMPNPKVIEKEGNLYYSGDKINIRLNTEDVVDTLERAYLFREKKQSWWIDLVRGPISFKTGNNEYDTAVIWSNWMDGENSYAIVATDYMTRFPEGIMVIGRV